MTVQTVINAALTVSIREMTAQDLPAVYDIDRQVQDFPWAQQHFIDSIQQKQRCLVLLNAQQQMIGFCIIQIVLDEANLLLMAISPDYQQQGLGFHLLNSAIDDVLEVTNQGCKMVFLEVRQSNVAAQALYQKAGFNEIGLRKNYYPIKQRKLSSTDHKAVEYEPAVLMALTLSF